MALDELLQDFGVWGPLAIIVLRAGAAMLALVPSSPLLLAAGASYGLFWGTIFVLIGAEAGALATFIIGRHLGRESIAKRTWTMQLARTRPGRWLLDDEASQTRLMLAVLYCRLLPGLNLDALGYVAGATPITIWRFALATFGGLLPYTLLLVGIGRQLITASMGEALIILVFLAVLLLAFMPVVRRFLY